MHRDLKPANILIGWLGTLKLADFGMAKALEPHSDLCATYCGSPAYMSPEQCTGKPYSFPADVWALGCISYELMTLRSPWLPEAKVHAYAQMVERIVHHTPPWAPLSDKYPANLVNLTRWMLLKDPTQRALASDVVSHLSMREVPALDVCETNSVLVRPDADGADEAAARIQRSFRERKAAAPRPAVPPSPRPAVLQRAALRPVDKEPFGRYARYRAPKPSVEPTEESSALVIQKAFVASLKRCPSRVDQLAAPRRVAPPRTKPLPAGMRPFSAVRPPLGSPRKAWA